ncbi:hypothetical protein GF367_01720 [Candidatus Woesearchaeota archaeon]|nr:hypothetical protein [Candidatus Woesearchaeota archaeon]
MVIYYAQGSWRDSEKEARRREETFSWLWDRVDTALCNLGAVRVANHKWLFEEMTLTLAFRPHGRMTKSLKR